MSNKVIFKMVAYALLANILSSCSVEGDGGTEQFRSDEATFDTTVFPDFYSLSTDHGQLLRGKVKPDDFYKVAEPKDFSLFFEQDDWFDDVLSATSQRERVNSKAIYEGETLDEVGVRFKGTTSFSGSQERKSFDIKLDHFIKGQDIDGYNTFNFNNSFEDPSYLREVFYSNRSIRHMPEPNSNFINLYINNEFYGLYSNVQQLDKDYLKQWYQSSKGTNWRAEAANSGFGAGANPPPGSGDLPGDGSDDGSSDGIIEQIACPAGTENTSAGFQPICFGVPGQAFTGDPVEIECPSELSVNPDGSPATCLLLVDDEPPGGSDDDGDVGDPIPCPPDTPLNPDGSEPVCFDGAPGGDFGILFGAGTSSLNYLGENVADYEAAYSLKTTKSETPYEPMIKATRLLDQVTKTNLDQLREAFDVDGALWYIAHEILFGDDDGYISKGGLDYHVYYDVATGRLIPYESDGNSVMFPENTYDIFYRIDDERYPVANKLLNIPELRQRYLAHVRTILRDSFDPETAIPVIERYRSLIESGVANDPHPHDGYTYEGLDSAVSVVTDFIASRYALLESNEELALSGPVISNVRHRVSRSTEARPRPSEPVTVEAAIEHSDGITGAYLYYGTGVNGTFTKIDMRDDGASIDGSANDGIYSAEIPALASGELVRYYVEAVAADRAGDHGTVSYEPVGAEHDVFVYRVHLDPEVSSPIVINEVMSDNESVLADDAGDFDDWIELHNTSDQAVSLAGLYLSDDFREKTRWALPDITIPANNYLIVWADDEEDQGNLHTNFKVSNKGEDVILFDQEGKIVDGVTLGKIGSDSSLARRPDGAGEFIVMDPTPGAKNQ